jgi:hypothetical protein
MEFQRLFMKPVVAAFLCGEVHELARSTAEPHCLQVHVPEDRPVDWTSVAGVGTSSSSTATGRTIEIRTGSVLNAADNPSNGVCLALLTAYESEGEPVWAAGIAEASGRAGHFLIRNEKGYVVHQGDITDCKGDGDLIFDNSTIVLGGSVCVSSKAA